MTSTTGTTPTVTGYVKGREVRPGMLINAADLLGMHERQGQTSGENPNPLGHQEWVRVGMIGNTNEKGFRRYGEGTLTGGMYVILDTSGHPVGRMSANTIVEMSGSIDGDAKHAVDTVRMPAKVRRVTQKRNAEGEMVDHVEMVDGYEAAYVPSKAAQEEFGLPAPRMLKDGILDPADPNYGANAKRPTPAHRPFGERVQGARTRDEAAADRAKRREVYASGEEERERRRAEAKARQREEAAAERAAAEAAAEVARTQRREADRRKSLREWNATMRKIIDEGGETRYDWEKREDVFNADADAVIADKLRSYNDSLTRNLARAYGVKWRGRTRDQMVADIIAAVKAGKTPDEEVDAPKAAAVVDEAAKIAAADKRRRTSVTNNFKEIDTYLAVGNEREASFHLNVMMSENAIRQLAEAFGLGNLSGETLKAALFEAIRAGRTPDLDAAPVTSLKKPRR